MKKLVVIALAGAIFISGAILNSCKKDDLRDQNPSNLPVMKDDPTCLLPIFMGQYNWIGCSEIYFEDPTIYVDLDLEMLPAGWEVCEGHLYLGEVAPPTSAPGQFPYHWYLDWGIPLGFEVMYEDWECETFDRYIALHLKLRQYTGVDEYGNPIYMYESAWLLAEGGMNWYNKKGNPIGWGEYFIFEFDYIPDAIELLADEGEASGMNWVPTGNWTYPVDGTFPDYEMCLVPDNPFYFFDIGDLSIPIIPETGHLNPFLLEEVDNPLFWSYWAAKGVDEFAAGGWEEIMWDIINGDLPMLYVKWNGTDYTLIDGLQYALGQGENPLRISGNYPADIYGFTGALQAEDCPGTNFTIYLEVGPCPPPEP